MIIIYYSLSRFWGLTGLSWVVLAWGSSCCCIQMDAAGVMANVSLLMCLVPKPGEAQAAEAYWEYLSTSAGSLHMVPASGLLQGACASYIHGSKGMCPERERQRERQREREPGGSYMAFLTPALGVTPRHFYCILLVKTVERLTQDPERWHRLHLSMEDLEWACGIENTVVTILGKYNLPQDISQMSMVRVVPNW